MWQWREFKNFTENSHENKYFFADEQFFMLWKLSTCYWGWCVASICLLSYWAWYCFVDSMRRRCNHLWNTYVNKQIDIRSYVDLNASTAEEQAWAHSRNNWDLIAICFQALIHALLCMTNGCALLVWWFVIGDADFIMYFIFMRPFIFYSNYEKHVLCILYVFIIH